MGDEDLSANLALKQNENFSAAHLQLEQLENEVLYRGDKKVYIQDQRLPAIPSHGEADVSSSDVSPQNLLR